MIKEVHNFLSSFRTFITELKTTKVEYYSIGWPYTLNIKVLILYNYLLNKVDGENCNYSLDISVYSIKVIVYTKENW